MSRAAPSGGTGAPEATAANGSGATAVAPGLGGSPDVRRTRPARVPAAVLEACGYFLPRLMFLQARYAPQIHWGDVALALDGFGLTEIDLGSAGFWDEWRARWTARAEVYVAAAVASTTAAGQARAYRGAAACYHWAEFMDFGDRARKLGLRRLVRTCFERSLTSPDPAQDGLGGLGGLGDDLGGGVRREARALPAGSVCAQPVPYWLYLPPRRARDADRPLACVVLSNGLDSMTEVEILSLAEAYLDRGIAAVLFEGPGQGLDAGQTPLRVDMESVVAALLDVLRADSRLAADRMAFLGVSFGGYLALRVARTLGPSLRCVVNFSGGPRIAPFATLPRRLRDDFRYTFGGGEPLDDDDMQHRFDALAFPSDPAPHTRVLSVHGALDDIFPLADLVELDRAWGTRHELVTHESEAHVCLNMINLCGIEIADWVAHHLRPDPR
ncbi:dienelactone hydrolase [Frankia sp. R43]|uniref:alpha/beta hydrolase family protein n=1 Tax=Frankia sp. R43 TaxID=269536 RepID=UPI0006CA234D|nr:dienelactone hydrolase [Frankia sp. R43]KPM56070.1 dienelactone hydrolase [Frankia sp. R43]